MKLLETLCPIPLKLIWHENKRTYISARKESGYLYLRLHRLFSNAPTPVLAAVIGFALKRDPQARKVVRQAAHDYFSQNPIASDPLCAQGKVYDLQEMFDRQNETLKIEQVAIGWSTREHTGRFRSLLFGTYDKHRRQIKIHPLLDSEQVPRYFVEFIVYHEMLHAVIPSKIGSVHPPAFRARERQFPQYEEAQEWSKKSLTFFKRRHGRS